MVCYLRSLTTWAHIAQCEAVSWTIPVFSTEDESGTVRVAGEHPDYSGCWVILDGRIFYGETASPSGGFTDLSICRPEDAFDRTLVYNGTGTEDLADFIVSTIEDKFVNEADAEYAMPYISVFAQPGGVNLFDMSAAVSGYLVGDGTSISDPDYEEMTSGFIRVVPGKTYTYKAYPSSAANPWTGYAFYSEKNLASVIGTRIVDQTGNAVIFTVPAGAKYMRIGSRYLETGEAQLEQGTTASVYEEYRGLGSVELAYLDNEVYAFLDIIDLAYEKKVKFTYEFDSDSLNIGVSVQSETAHTVIFGDGHNHLEDVTVSNELVARVTVRRINTYDDEIEVTASTDYYWHKGGEITTEPPNPRLKGIWDIVSVEDADIELIDAAKEAMEDNDEAVKVTFYSDEAFALGDKITCRINDEVLTEPITSCSLSSNDPQYLYTLGKLPTTLTDQFNQKSKERQEKSVTYEGASTDYVPTSGGTVGGTLNVQDTTSTKRLVVGSDSYGTSLPSTGVAGQVFYKI